MPELTSESRESNQVNFTFSPLSQWFINYWNMWPMICRDITEFVALSALVAGCVAYSCDVLSHSHPSCCTFLNVFPTADLIRVLIVFLMFCDWFVNIRFCCTAMLNSLAPSLLTSLKSQNSLHERKWFIGRSHFSVSGHSEGEEEWWRVSCPQHWPRSVLWSRPIQASAALS